MMRVGRDSAGFRQLLAAIAEAAPGPRVAVCVEGSRSYGTGLGRALAAAGLPVPGCEQPARRRRRGKGRPGPVGAHLAVLAAPRLDAGRRPVPRAGGGREAVRILPVARREITAACAGQSGRLRALLLAGDDTGRRAARTALPGRAPAALATPGTPRPCQPRAGRPPGPDRPPGSAAEPGPGPAQRQPRPAAGHRRGHRPRPGQPVRRGPGQRGPGHRQLLPPRPVPRRGRVRRPRRDQPDPGQQRADRPPPAQPGPGPGAEPRHPRHRAGPDAQLPPDPRPRRPAHRRGKDRPGDPPLPQALHRPRALPVPHPDDESSGGSLTNIEVVRVAACDALRG